jgi:hypothetical protein
VSCLPLMYAHNLHSRSCQRTLIDLQAVPSILLLSGASPSRSTEKAGNNELARGYFCKYAGSCRYFRLTLFPAFSIDRESPSIFLSGSKSPPAEVQRWSLNMSPPNSYRPHPNYTSSSPIFPGYIAITISIDQGSGHDVWAPLHETAVRSFRRGCLARGAEMRTGEFRAETSQS